MSLLPIPESSSNWGVWNAPVENGKRLTNLTGIGGMRLTCGENHLLADGHLVLLSTLHKLNAIGL